MRNDYNTFYLIGLDPGNNTGVAIFELNTLTLDIVNITTAVIVLNNQVRSEIDLQLERTVRLHNLCLQLSNTYNPNVLAIEAAFLNSRFPKAVMQLSQYTTTVEQAFYVNNNFIKLYKYPPKYIKKIIGAGGNADKEAMSIAVSNIAELSNNVDLSRVTEHEIDAMAIGYITINYIRKYPHTLISY